MSGLQAFFQRLGFMPALLAAIALFALMMMTFLDVILRSTINNPIEAATELTRWLMAVVVFASLPIVTLKGDHISVDLLDRFFPPLAMRLRDALLSLICGALLFLPAERCLVLAERAREYGDVTEYLGMPQFYVAWFISLATFATAAMMVLRGLLQLFKPELLEVSTESDDPVS